MSKRVVTCILLLVCSNIFMNTAWYGHLKFKTVSLWLAILASWGIASLEYCFQVPANRIGNGALTVTQLKVIQEIITLVTFSGFSFLVFREKPTANHAIVFALVVGAAYFVVKK